MECEYECEYPWKGASFKEIPNSNVGIAGLTYGMFGELVACNPGIILTTLIGVVPSADNMTIWWPAKDPMYALILSKLHPNLCGKFSMSRPYESS